MSAPNEKTALIAMSGGVDSSVAAYLTQQAGYECLGATMRLFRNEDIGRSRAHPCCSQADIDDAAEVAFRLDIPHIVPDFTEAFRRQVIDRFARVYAEGATPNPCIDCNRYMKFDRLFALADEKGLARVVTGHYARIEFCAETGRYALKKALDETKDQSYVLYTLTQEQLKRLMLPLGALRKTEVRAIAEERGFCNARKHDSQDICFVPDGDYGRFLEIYTGRPIEEGRLLDLSGKELGTHRGALRYTVGQRRGIGAAAGERVYVVKKDMAQNTVTLGPAEALYHRALLVEDLNWIAFDAPAAPFRCKAMLRYRAREQLATVYPQADGSARVEFDEAQRAISPGQAAVFYDDDAVIGGGTIMRVTE